VLRLARFNVQLVSFDDKLFFKGLPIPGGALTIVSFVVFYVNTNFFDAQTTKILVLAVVFFVGFCMVSKIKFPNFPRPSFNSFKNNPILFIGVILAFIVGFITMGKSVFPTMVIYILYSIIRHCILLFVSPKNKKQIN
jgi:phosphatidylserine synthase